MIGEFRKRIGLLGVDKQTKEKIIGFIKEVGYEFPCLKYHLRSLVRSSSG